MNLCTVAGRAQDIPAGKNSGLHDEPEVNVVRNNAIGEKESPPEWRETLAVPCRALERGISPIESRYNIRRLDPVDHSDSCKKGRAGWNLRVERRRRSGARGFFQRYVPTAR